MSLRQELLAEQRVNEIQNELHSVNRAIAATKEEEADRLEELTAKRLALLDRLEVAVNSNSY